MDAAACRSATGNHAVVDHLPRRRGADADHAVARFDAAQFIDAADVHPLRVAWRARRIGKKIGGAADDVRLRAFRETIQHFLKGAGTQIVHCKKKK